MEFVKPWLLIFGPQLLLSAGEGKDKAVSEEQQNRCSVLSRFGKGGGEGQFDFN